MAGTVYPAARSVYLPCSPFSLPCSPFRVKPFVEAAAPRRLACPRVEAASRAMASAECTPLLSLRDLPEQRYRGVLLDQFGVLHDGLVPYPGAIQAVQFLHSRGMKLLIISNSSRRSSGALGNLGKMGFPVECFAGVVTSGEVTHSHLSSRPGAFWAGLGSACIHVTWAARGAISVEGLGVEPTLDPGAASFILAHGTEALGRGDAAPAQPASVDELLALLDECAAQGRSLPMIVANPDIVTVSGSELRTMPGTLARHYAALGGEVRLMGKPDPVIYEAALRMLGLPPEAVIAVGDSMEHDIGGAAAAGVDSVLIGGGIHAAELGVPGPAAAAGAGVDAAALRALCQRLGTAPTYSLPYFSL